MEKRVPVSGLENRPACLLSVFAQAAGGVVQAAPGDGFGCKQTEMNAAEVAGRHSNKSCPRWAGKESKQALTSSSVIDGFRLFPAASSVGTASALKVDG